jgi:NAD(P)-dependent dehydrogenase (short-subunit alcohol dehydrogenase family)
LIARPDGKDYPHLRTEDAPVREEYDALIAAGMAPIRRWGEGQDVAQAVVALAAHQFPFSTGERINVDGGFHIRRL